MELQGKLIKLNNEVKGEGRNGAWIKQEFVIETIETYPKKVCIAAWGEKVDQIKQISIGEVIKVAINLESREYNDRWYTEARAWKIDRVLASSATPVAQATPTGYAPASPSQGVAQTPVGQFAEAPPAPAFGENESDDLPF